MGPLEIVFLALALSMDSFSVALSVGCAGQATGKREAFRLAFFFGLFQGGLPILGWFAGTLIEPIIAPYDHWIAFSLLLFVAIRMIRSGVNQTEDVQQNDPTRGLPLLLLSIATSIDALSVGLGLSMLGMKIWTPSIVIGLITMLVSAFGVTTGSRLGLKFGKRMQIVGGVVLIMIGIRIVVSHMIG